jgi:hypothetical protein
VPGLLLASAPAVAAADCVAWPGEPEPLPTLEDPDPLRAAWAEARASELNRIAGVLAKGDRVEAYRIRQHVRCLDPSNVEWAAAADQERPATVHRPGASVGSRGATAGFDGALRHALHEETPSPVVAKPTRRVLAAKAPANRSASLARPVSNPGPPSRETAPEWLDESLRAVALLIKEARFRSALESVNGIQAQASRLTPSDAVRKRLAHVEVLAGTAKIALGQTDSARDHFRRALDADPALELDGTTSPKVRRTFDSVRSAP